VKDRIAGSKATLKPKPRNASVASPPLAHPRLPVTVIIAGIAIEVTFAGSVPGLVGILQINLRVPGGFLAPGKADLSLSIGGTAASPIPIWLK
jgi:uncharacterized protein (TIGR03437 family)